jgi:hypothetical protein
VTINDFQCGRAAVIPTLTEAAICGDTAYADCPAGREPAKALEGMAVIAPGTVWFT